MSIRSQIMPTASGVDIASPGPMDRGIRSLIHDSANGLRRISLPRTPVNKGKKRRVTGLRCYPVAWTSTTQSEEAEFGGAPRLLLPPPLTV
jgi:hypothetical protein